MPGKATPKKKKQKSPFGARIRKIRELEGLSRPEFAEITGVSVNTLMGYENQGKDPSGSNLERIAKVFPEYIKLLFLEKDT